MSVIQRCIHCGQSISESSLACSACKTIEGRAKVDAENTKIFADAGLKFVCKGCDDLKRMMIIKRKQPIDNL